MIMFMLRSTHFFPPHRIPLSISFSYVSSVIIILIFNSPLSMLTIDKVDLQFLPSRPLRFSENFPLGTTHALSRRFETIADHT